MAAVQTGLSADIFISVSHRGRLTATLSHHPSPLTHLRNLCSIPGTV